MCTVNYLLCSVKSVLCTAFCVLFTANIILGTAFSEVCTVFSIRVLDGEGLTDVAYSYLNNFARYYCFMKFSFL